MIHLFLILDDIPERKTFELCSVFLLSILNQLLLKIWSYFTNRAWVSKRSDKLNIRGTTYRSSWNPDYGLNGKLEKILGIIMVFVVCLVLELLEAAGCCMVVSFPFMYLFVCLFYLLHCLCTAFLTFAETWKVCCYLSIIHYSLDPSWTVRDPKWRSWRTFSVFLETLCLVLVWVWAPALKQQHCLVCNALVVWDD